ncbi:MAG: glycosyltransferase family 4 protein [Clostridiales bacterium]|nr:glycosyltransferase family 4 protein [Clostridiales bacterium]
MKVIHFISGGDTGGAKTHVLSLLKNLLKLNIDVSLLCIMEGVFTEEAKEIGIPVKIIPQEKRYDVRVFKKIADYINGSGADLVHCHGARANYITMFIRHKVKAPMITTLHSDYKLDFAGNFKKNLIYTPINAFALRRFSCILTVTEAFRAMMEERGFKAERLRVIYNGIDMENIPPVMEKDDFLKKYCPAEVKNKLLVGIAARFQAVKGVDVFIKAAERVLNKRKDTAFLIAGDGDEGEKLKAYVRERNIKGIYFLGQLPYDLIDSFYNALDVNVLSSYSESFPYALLEGGRMKKATASTLAGGVAEMIDNEKTGLLSPTGDFEKLGDNIGRLLKDEGLRNMLGKNFYNKINSDFSLVSMAKRHVKIYSEVIENEKA